MDEQATGDEPQAQLEQTTGPAQRPTVPPETPDALTVAEVVDLYETSEKTVRRHLKDERLTGAFQVSGTFGKEWRIPVQALQDSGLKLRSQAAADSTAQAEVVVREAGELVDELRRSRDQAEDRAERLQSLLDRRQLQLEEQTGLAAEREADLQRELGRLEGENSQLRDQLEQASRRWWRRKPKPQETQAED